MMSASLRATILAGVAVLTTSCATNKNRTQPTTQPMVTADVIEQNAGQPIEEVLQAKVPGVVVTRASGGGVAIRIRGSGSFYSSNEPLYVLDGVPFEPGPGGALTGINPHDIDTIKVLKDPADTGLYGVRGANGVIVITMKKPGGRRSQVPPT